MAKVELFVNGRAVTGEAEDRTLLVHFLRENLGLTGTHVGCDTSQCGACVVHVDGRAVKSCTMLAAQASGSTITTIEGLSPNGELHPLQVAFRENHALQCGFCTPGMIMSFGRYDHGGIRMGSMKQPCGPSLRAIFAAAPAITTSSRPCSTHRTKWARPLSRPPDHLDFQSCSRVAWRLDYFLRQSACDREK